MEAAEKISVGVIKEKTKSKAVKKEAEGMRVSTREKVCYGVGDIGANLVWTTVASFLTIYCTDVAGIAAGVVGTLMLIARLFDGVSDLFMGVIIDKTNTRWGKARPWVLWSAPPLVVSLIMIFTVPNIGANGKAIYMLLVYIFLAAVCFTASNLSYNTMLSLVTTEQHDRNVMNTIRKLSRETGLEAMFINKKFKAKDVSDAVKANNFEEIKNWLNETIKNYR